MNEMAKEIPAHERLAKLPPVFRATDAALRFRWDAKTTAQYLWQWKRRGLIEGLGGKSDVFAIKLLGQDVNWEVAAKKVMPTAIVVGLEILLRENWITQIVQRPDLVVAPVDTAFKLDRFNVQRRPAEWFTRMRRGMVAAESDAVLPTLRPAWALADMLAQEGWGACGIQPDDIDWSAVTDRDRRQWVNAIRAVGLAPEVIERDEEVVEAMSLR